MTAKVTSSKCVRDFRAGRLVFVIEGRATKAGVIRVTSFAARDCAVCPG
jgi:hypothetical protein